MPKERKRSSSQGRKRRSVADAHGIRLHFLGAARAVTGSLHFFEVNWEKESFSFFLDCGGVQESSERNPARKVQKRLPLDYGSTEDFTVQNPTGKASRKAIKALPSEFAWGKVAFGVVSHSHFDHVGDVPYAHKNGFTGPVFATPAAVALSRIQLPDSGYLQEQAAKKQTKRNERRCDEVQENGVVVKGCDEDEINVVPRYTEAEAIASLALFRTVDYDQSFKVRDGVTIKFTHASHLLGAAVVTLELGKGASKRRIVFSGDIGPPNMPILKELAPVKHADYLILEGTYGTDVHPQGNRQALVADVLKRAVERAMKYDPVTGYGVIVVAAFAFGRLQSFLYDLKQIGFDLPVFVDSPMAIKASEVYRRYTELYNPKAAKLLTSGGDLFSPKIFAELPNWQDSVKLDEPAKKPIMILGSSGMAVGGRIVRHLEARLGVANNTAMFLGYQAHGTLGRHLTTPGITEAKIYGQIVPVRATIEHLHVYSGHADCQHKLRWMRGFEAPPRKTFLVHGDEEKLLAFQEMIQRELGWDVEVPRFRQSFELE
jgi:metallo-beta-lactamase family protein